MMKRSVTIRDVASHANVSTATVSRVLNDDKCVIESTRERVRSSMEELGYKVNFVARSLKTSKTKTIGIMIPDLSGDFFTYVAESLDRELAALGYSLVVSVSHDSAEEEVKRIRHLAERLVDGIVMIPATNKGAHVGFLKDFGIPLVYVDRTVVDQEVDAVLSENEEGAFAATMALIRDGYTRIGFIGGNPEISTSQERFSGYRRALAASGLPIEEEFIRFGPPTLPFGYRAMEEMLQRNDSPDAWFLVNAFTHIGATNCLLTEGSEKNQRIVFSAFDEMPYSPLLRFCRYSVQQAMAEMGKSTARMILGRISGTDLSPPRTLRLKTRLIRHRWGSTPSDETIHRRKFNG